MGHAVVGDAVYSGGDVGRDPIETAGDHSEATAIAIDRSSAGGKSKAAVAATAYTEVALDFDDAETYLVNVDLDAARAADLREAVTAGATDAEIAALNKRTDAAVRKAHQKTVRIKVADRAGRHGGVPYAAGAGIVQDASGHVSVVSAAELKAGYSKVGDADKEK